MHGDAEGAQRSLSTESLPDSRPPPAVGWRDATHEPFVCEIEETDMAKTASLRQTIGRIAARRGKEEAQLWALHNGYAVSWKGGALTVKPL